MLNIDHRHSFPSLLPHAIERSRRDRHLALIFAKVVRVDLDHVVFPGLHLILLH
jgi:hypothetical protein